MAGSDTMTIDPKEFQESYKEYARKMDLFMDGPTTTCFEQLREAGIDLPEPDALADADLRPKLWEVLAGLEKLRTFLEHTNHLTDRELYAKLWHETLREETPAINEIGFDSHINLARFGGNNAEDQLWLKYYADQSDRERWRRDYPEDEIPPHEDPPFTRDDLIPGPHETVPEAAAWLRANWSESAFATNRFGSTAKAIEFVDQLYEMGATGICVDNVRMLPNHDWTPYADTLLVRLPEDSAKRSALFDHMKQVGKPDKDGGDDHLLIDSGQGEVRLWWD
jgi:hypothetical protein